jgi:LysM repeat protein
MRRHGISRYSISHLFRITDVKFMDQSTDSRDVVVEGPSGSAREAVCCRASRRLAMILPAAAIAVAVAAPVSAQSLRGSKASLDLQNRQAEFHDYTYLSGRQDLHQFVEAGLLVPLEGNANYRLSNVSFNVARPEVKLFVERLAAQHVQACGEPLVVTSLTRPKAYQPRNASDRSVHPTGMALDLRIPQRTTCRSWLESTLLALERRRVLEVTRERRPPHYHVALFPAAYVSYVESLTGESKDALLASNASPATGQAVGRLAEPPPAGATAEAAVRTSASTRASTTTAAPARSSSTTYVVRRGDTLWRIAREHGISTTELRRANGLSSSRIKAGQRLRIPARD